MHIDVDAVAPWTLDWLWGLPLCVVTVVIHVVGLFGIKQIFDHYFARATRRTFPGVVVTLIAGTTVMVTMLHGLEATIWAFAFRFLGALPNQKAATLYSLNALTTFGHAGFTLEGQWHLMGSLEALNGWILFGLSTAFLYAVIQEVWARATPDMMPHRRPVSASS